MGSEEGVRKAGNIWVRVEPLSRRQGRSLAGASYREWGAGVCASSSPEKTLWKEDFHGGGCHSGGGSGVSLSPVLGPQVQVWSGSLGRPRGCLGSLPLSPALSVALNPDGDRVAVGYRADGIRIYKIASGTEEREDGVFGPLERTSPP